MRLKVIHGDNALPKFTKCKLLTFTICKLSRNLYMPLKPPYTRRVMKDIEMIRMPF